MKKLSIAKEYTTKQGEVKTQWYNCGIAITKQNGKESIMLKDDFNYSSFAKDGNIWINASEDESSSANNSQVESKEPDFDDDIPF